MSNSPPAKGAIVELQGLVAKPQLNGCRGVVISKYDPQTERCGVRLDDGTGVNVKLSNLVCLALSTSEAKLERALERLKKAGGREKEPEDDDDDNNANNDDPAKYLDELLGVGDARYELGQYDEAGSIFYRAYYATIRKSNGRINNPELFPVAHKMIQAWIKSDKKHLRQMAHGMAQSTCMMPGCPVYIRQDMNQAAKAMARS